jgi:hypothetical protein
MCIMYTLSSTAAYTLQELADATGIQAGIPTVAVRKQISDTIDCPTGIMDVVVSIG